MSIEKELNKAADKVQDFVENIPDDKEHAAKKCFEAFEEANIKICNDKGQEIKSWEEFLAQPDAYIYKNADGNYDKDFCVEAVKKRGYAPCDEISYPEAAKNYAEDAKEKIGDIAENVKEHLEL